jgi:SpoVK/Ycf46/Vps4 family AAA+-type ATPase
MDEIGGLSRLKKWLHQRKDAMREDAREMGLSPPRGVMLLGVQGAGKSLAAKAIAAAWKRPLMKLDPSVLYDRYVGESERRLREALAQAEAMSPVILWIDEIEKGFAGAASTSNDGGLSRRMFGTLLNWMQEHSSPVFLVATANDIEALPPELLRKGRFDEIFFVDLPGDEARRKILAIHLKKRKQDPAAFDLALLAERCEGYSGAEIEQAVISALHGVYAGRARQAAASLTTERLLEAILASPPLSVTMAEKINALREWARGRCVPAD